MSLTFRREKQIKKEGKRSKVPLIRIGFYDKPRPHNCQFEPIRKLLLEGQGHRVKVPASRVCQEQLLCKVSSSPLTLLQRNELYLLT